MLELVEKHRSAPITTVTEARQKLLEYGQPALRLVRSVSTPRIAEGFHMFLLSLYDSLAAVRESRRWRLSSIPAAEIVLDRINSRPLPYGTSRRETTGSRFLRDRSIWTTVPSGPIKTLAGISETPYACGVVVIP